MDSLISALSTSGEVIRAEVEAIRRLAAGTGMSGIDLQAIGRIQAWIDRELPELRRRNRLAKAADLLPAWAPGLPSGLVTIDESTLLSAGEARRQGEALAARFDAIHPGNLGIPGGKYNSDKLAAVIRELGAHEHDADYTAAFFAALGATKSLAIPAKLRAGTDDPGKAIDTISRALGTAVREGGHVPGFAEVRYELATGTPLSSGLPLPVGPFAGLRRTAGSTPSRDELEAPPVERIAGGVGTEALGELIRAGDFPAEWLAAVVDRHALHPESVVNGAGLAGFLDALAHNPAAARLALSRSAGRGESLPDFLSRMNHRVSPDRNSTPPGQEKTSPAAAFGRMLAGAAGAYDEKDGAHSEPAATLAFQLIRELPKLDIHRPTRVHLAELAGAYATEITEGANLGDANRTQPSAFGPVTSLVAGLKPAFRLSPEDTYAFVKLFADAPENIKPFEQAMGGLADRLAKAAARDSDPKAAMDRLEDAMKALGYVAGMQFAAERSVQSKLDQEDEERRKAAAFVLGLALGVGGIPVPLEGQVLWLALSTVAPQVHDAVTEPDPTRMKALDDKSDAASLIRTDWLVRTLISSGFEVKVPPTSPRFSDPPIANEDGLLPFAQIAKDKAALRNYNDWLIANGSGGEDDASLGEAIMKMDTIFRGTKDAAEEGTSPFNN
ncbi:hypothetical protein HNP84_003603 [Thermocatellispora tengchongensis]|uniref:DUF6571 domain-containing protein n=1 Tax=Thermocatellispora tengchongensis TaxID=1073253 RepID=A0A840P9J7_9ACTN|nr:DUF6571 family protein [Thermocatellispora tengchongensis]MBB5133877.1 hypothetical protein [Thermocatellispora tengchongensis]